MGRLGNYYYIGFALLLHLLLFTSTTESYKKDYGLGFMYKHDPNMKEREKAERLTNDRIRGALGGIGNGSLFPEPFELSSLETKFSGATLHFSEARVYGLNRIRPLRINSDFTNLIVSLTLSMDQLNVLGRFQMTPWVQSTVGNFNFTIIDSWLTLEAELMLLNEGTDQEGLYVSDIRRTELTYDELHLNFDGIGLLSTILQPVKNTFAKYIFSQVKPALCTHAELNFRRILNEVLTHLPKECPNAVNIVDKALLRARKSMKSSLLDPLYIPDDYPKSTKLLKFELTQGKLFGLSSIKRIGPILMGFERHAVYMNLHLGVQNLKGQYTWTMTLWKNLMTHRGALEFNVRDIAIKVKLEKRVGTEDNENVTRVDQIELKIGSITLLSEGAVKYIMETFLNVVPDSFRQKITDAAEYRLLKVIENEVLQIDLEHLVEEDEPSSNESGEGA